LTDLGLTVSTGRVVDFRATPLLRQHPSENTVPLIYPRNFENGFIVWPKPGGKKAQAFAVMPGAEDLLVPRGTYVLVKRFRQRATGGGKLVYAGDTGEEFAYFDEELVNSLGVTTESHGGRNV
jgi:adenine-specific DNA-methyltransferase